MAAIDDVVDAVDCHLPTVAVGRAVKTMKIETGKRTTTTKKKENQFKMNKSVWRNVRRKKATRRSRGTADDEIDVN